MATNQPNGLKRIGENPHVYDHRTYFAWFSMRGKQIKCSLRTEDKAVARRRLADLREKAGRLHGAKQSSIQFEGLAAVWLGAIRSELKASTHKRRAGCAKQLPLSFKGVPVRSRRLQMGGKNWTHVRQLVGYGRLATLNPFELKRSIEKKLRRVLNSPGARRLKIAA